jgi:hypothetical protein
MISDYCDFTIISTFSATSQLLDVKRALALVTANWRGDGKLHSND